MDCIHRWTFVRTNDRHGIGSRPRQDGLHEHQHPDTTPATAHVAPGPSPAVGAVRGRAAVLRAGAGRRGIIYLRAAVARDDHAVCRAGPAVGSEGGAGAAAGAEECLGGRERKDEEEGGMRLGRKYIFILCLTCA